MEHFPEQHQDVQTRNELDEMAEHAWHNLWTAHLNLKGHKPGTHYFAERLSEVEGALKVYEQVIGQLKKRAGLVR